MARDRARVRRAAPKRGEMATVTLSDVDRISSDGTRILDDMSLTVADGELMVIVGPSGSGKT
ncbi:MAG: hypothetical protein HKN91_13170, partial [Acidimicrobiia bacterium]|nr:hypothetical protein [Acidimicrobiia bacterium]